MSKERKFPLLGSGHRVGSIPWWVAEQAYIVYASKYGDSQSLERLAERGGFGISEMDEFFPEWREKASVIEQLQAELATHRWIPVGEDLQNDAYYIATDGIICEWLYFNEVWYYAATKKPYPRFFLLRQCLPISMPVCEPTILPEGE